jgi:hypothetical protein
MPCVLILNDRGVITSIRLWPKPAAPQLYSIATDPPSSFSTFAEHAFDRCSNRASEAMSPTHWRTGALLPGAPLISHRPGRIWDSADGCPAALSASAAATPAAA